MSFIKTFLIFLTLFEVLLAINFWDEYQVRKLEIEDKIHIEMKLCAFTIQCEGLKTDFVDRNEDKEENTLLYQDGDYADPARSTDDRHFEHCVVFYHRNWHCDRLCVWLGACQGVE